MIDIPKELHSFRFIKTREKIPIEPRWNKDNNYSYDSKEFQEYIKKNLTYGVLCGSNGLLVVDIDNREVQEQLSKEYPFNSTFAVKTAGKGLLHYYFISDKVDSFRHQNAQGGTLFDVQGEGTQVIGAGSTLSTGKKYEVAITKPILKIKYSNLIDKLKELGYHNKNEQENKQPKKSINYFERDPHIDEIKEKLTISKYISELGIDNRRSPTKCPLGHPSVGEKCFSFIGQVWYCFHCKEKGDIFTLYQKINNCDFLTAKYELMEKTGITKKILKKVIKETKEAEKEAKRGVKEEIRQERKIEEQEKRQERESNVIEYTNLDIKQFVIYKSKEETLYKIYLPSFFITLDQSMLLSDNHFRKLYFNETGYLLPYLTPSQWRKMINDWVQEKGQMIDNTQELNSNQLLIETIISEIENFVVVKETNESANYGRLLFFDYEPEYIYLCNKVLFSILKKNEIKITASKLKVLLDNYVEGNNKQIRVGRQNLRFFRLKLNKFPTIMEEAMKSE